QTYLERFEAETPRAPTGATPEAELEQRRIAIRQISPLPQKPNLFQEFLQAIQGPVYQGPSLAEQTRIYPGSLSERMAQGPAQMAAIYQGLGVNLGQQ
ncbi:unnamed protein product, partial [marine sediment metagenome]